MVSIGIPITQQISVARQRSAVAACPVEPVSKGKKRNWLADEAADHIQAAMDRIQDGEPLRQVHRDTGIPHSTLRNHAQRTTRDGSPRRGRKIVLGDFEEKLRAHIIDMAERGFGLSWAAVRTLALKMADTLGVRLFAASNGWLMRFRRRANLSHRVAERFERTRAGAMNKQNIHQYFLLLEKARNLVQTKSGGVLDAKQIYTMDESGSSMDAARRHIVCARGTKLPQILASSNREHITVCAVQRADGHQPPPYYTIKGVRRNFDRLDGGKLKGVPAEAAFSMTAKGYVTDEAWLEFTEWLVVSLTKSIRTMRICGNC